jgi:hypothetical protein
MLCIPIKLIHAPHILHLKPHAPEGHGLSPSRQALVRVDSQLWGKGEKMIALWTVICHKNIRSQDKNIISKI